MAFDDSDSLLAGALLRPQIRLHGEVDGQMLDRLVCEAEGDDSEGPLALELTTSGGDADYGRRLALEIARLRTRLGRRIVFLGATAVYSAGVTVMSGFPRRDRFLTADAVLLIHCRQLRRTVELQGPLQASRLQVSELSAMIESGLELEDGDFARLIVDSDVTLEEIICRATCSWYVCADEAVRRRLVEAIV